MKIYKKKFNELTLDELYEILKLRVDVFVVEQNCPYKEIDDLDKDSIHAWIEDEGEIIAYLRIMGKDIESEYVSIGRVIAKRRGCGLGKEILSIGIETAKEIYNADKIYLEAQTYAKGFYEKLGFKQISNEFIIDNIPHIKMFWNNNY